MPSLDSPDADLDQAVIAYLDWLARPCAAMVLAGQSVDPVGSRLGGHPYLRQGETWPSSPVGWYLFVAQVNFAEVPPLPGFPTAGLLQWYTEPSDCYGLTFDDDAGAVGFHVRWYPAPYGPAAAPPSATGPAPDKRWNPLEIAAATALVFEPARSLPEWDELPEVARQDPIWAVLARRNGEDPADVRFGYSEFARGGSSPYGIDRAGSKVGGFASFTQADPRPSGSYPPIGHPAASLLVELDSGETGGWGDAGIAHLFGDPARIGWGDLSSVRYHWDCS